MSYIDGYSDGYVDSDDSEDSSSDLELSRLRKNKSEEYSGSEEDLDSGSSKEEEEPTQQFEVQDDVSGSEESEEAPIRQRRRGKVKGTKLNHNRYVLEKIEGDTAVEMGRYPTIQGIADALGFPYHKAYGIWRGQNRALCKKYIISKLD